MSITLTSLITDLKDDVPAIDSVPSDDQYERAIKEAVVDFSRRCGTEKIATLSVVSGTAAYSLPDDFLKLIQIETPGAPDGVLISTEGIIPLPAEWSERFTIRGNTITFYPTPSYSMAKDYRYKAGWVLADDNETYEEMTREEADIILTMARSVCLTKQANALSGNVLDYQQGDVRVSEGTNTLSLRADSDAAQADYRKKCDLYNGQYGILA